MTLRKTALEIAFELARSGKCLTVPEIVTRLKPERYDAIQVEGPALRKQLLRLIAEAKR
jgi:hypothetical protein